MNQGFQSFEINKVSFVLILLAKTGTMNSVLFKDKCLLVFH